MRYIWITFLALISQFSILSSFLLIIFFLNFKKRNNEKKLWAISFYILLSFLTDVFLNYFMKLLGLEHVKFFIFTAFTLLEYSFFSYFFYQTLNSITFKKIVFFAYPVFILLSAYGIIIFRQRINFDSISAPAEAIHIIIFSILFFYEQLNKPEITFVYATKNFWIVNGFLVYLSSTLFLFILSTYLTKEYQSKFWSINDMANIMKNIFFAIAFSKPSEKLVHAWNRRSQQILR